MQTDIGTYIGELLYQHESVAVPGLGSFVKAYQPAEVDQVRGELHPPGSKPNFNPNLVADDGLLLNELQMRQGLGLEEAKAALRSYTENIKAALERQEMVDFPEVGRLYQDYEKNLQFLPDHNNFSLASYGLPMVKAYPVARQQRRPTTASVPLMTRKSPVVSNYALLGAITVGAIVILVAGYFLLFSTQPSTEQALAPVPTSRVNVSPSDEKASTDSTEEEPLEEGILSEEEQQMPDEEAEEWDSERPTTAPGQKRLVIIIGAFGNKENVTRLIDQIYDAGYEPYTEKSGPLTKVGVQKAYTDTAEIERVLNDVRNRFNSDAKLIKQ